MTDDVSASCRELRLARGGCCVYSGDAGVTRFAVASEDNSLPQSRGPFFIDQLSEPGPCLSVGSIGPFWDLHGPSACSEG